MALGLSVNLFVRTNSFGYAVLDFIIIMTYAEWVPVNIHTLVHHCTIRWVYAAFAELGVTLNRLWAVTGSVVAFVIAKFI